MLGTRAIGRLKLPASGATVATSLECLRTRQ
jgi:hypothetical protein